MEGPIPMWINGQEVNAKATEPLVASSSDASLHSFSSASVEDCLKAVEAAKTAFATWSKTPVPQRRDILLKASDLLLNNPKRCQEWSEMWLAETGEAGDRQFYDQIPYLVGEYLKDAAGRISTAMTGHVPACLDPGKEAMIVKEPYGVCFAMAPWNVPHILGVRAVLYAIATGNTAVLKGSELSPKCYWQIGKLFKDAGLPDGVLSVIVSRREDSAETVRQIIEHPAVRHVNFTGSTNVGRIVAGLAGKNLKPCIMELGGKSSSVILEDADLEKAAATCVGAAFLHSGQICMSTERVIVHESVAENFLKCFKGAAEAFAPKNGHVLSSKVGVDKPYTLASDAVKQGAHLIYGSLEKPSENGFRMNPVILGGVKKGMNLFYTESFGPQVSVYTFKDELEAIDLVNDTDYGLSSAVFSKDIGRAIRVARQIESGAVHINGSTVGDDPSWPHGGTKNSGFGRFNASYGMDSFLKLKTISWES